MLRLEVRYLGTRGIHGYCCVIYIFIYIKKKQNPFLLSFSTIVHIFLKFITCNLLSHSVSQCLTVSHQCLTAQVTLKNNTQYPGTPSAEY